MILKQCEHHSATEGFVIFMFEDNGMSTTKALPEFVQKQLLMRKKQFEGKVGEVLEIPYVEEVLKPYIFVGLGKEEEFIQESLRKAVGKSIKTASQLKLKSISMLVDNESEANIKIISEMAIEASYTFDLYKSDKKPFPVEEVEMVTLHQQAVEEGIIIGESNLLARVLVNEPANVLTPIVLADRAVEVGKKYGFEVSVMDEKEIQALDMKAYWEVAKASSNLPRFITMTYKGNPESEEILGFVGKGLTFDTGGYSIKPPASMLTMKSDMGGSAAVIGAMAAIARTKLKVNVTAVVAACENMVSGAGYRPGDIIGSRGGKSIFINSTDAEGRLTLVDAVDYIIKDLNVTKVIDIATLTGACLVALGLTTTGVVSNDDAFYQVLESASLISNEKVWRMPMFPEYKELLKHKEADLTNSTKMAGMITAGMFIGEFVGKTPWIHMDIAGTSWTDSGNEYLSYGGTGAGMKNLYYVAKQLAK